MKKHDKLAELLAASLDEQGFNASIRVRPSYAHVSCEEKDATSAGSSGQAFGQAGTSDSHYSERRLIFVHCS